MKNYDITIYFSTGKHLIFKNITNLNIFANNMNFDIIWSSQTEKINFKKASFKDYVGYCLFEIPSK